MNYKYLPLICFARKLLIQHGAMSFSMNLTAKQIAQKRVQVLFEEAKRTYKENPVLAQSYVLTARKIAMAARMRFPPIYKRSICKNCNNFLVPGESSRTRIKQSREPHVSVTCLKCGNKSRFALKSKKKEKTKIEQNNNKDETSR
jgi:ribonuclease P protein subunit RPR2